VVALGAAGYVSSQSATAPVTDTEAVGLRITLGIEAMGFKSGPGFGGNFGGLITIEGERWGVALSGYDIVVPADDGSYEIDHIGNLSGRLTFAFLSGQYGRLRMELGADVYFAPSIVMVGPTGGFSGVVWFGGPVGLEASVMVTPWPFTQVDARAGLALGLGQWGLRAGWRVQALNDRGLVDGVPHGDLFTGPYVGASFVF
jgi:hypothetical protein